MKSRLVSFNIYLCAAAVFLAGGCGTGGLDPKKEYTQLGVYLEARNGAAASAQMVQVAGTPIYIDSDEKLSEADVTKAKLLDYPDGTYAVQVAFSDHGMIVLDMTTSSSRGLDLVIYTYFPPKGVKQPKDEGIFSAGKTAPGEPRVSCWSATRIKGGITGGVLTFTPDASRAEADRIVRGLNNMVVQINKMGGND